MKSLLGCKGQGLKTRNTLPGWAPAACMLLAVAGCARPPAPVLQAAPPVARVTAAGRDAPLTRLFWALDDLRHGGPPVVALQLGDSHTANDSFSGEMRARLQARFGNAGRGPLQPGIPFPWYRPGAVHVEQSGFAAVSALNPANPGPFGTAAVRQHAGGVADATLTATDGLPIDAASVEFYAQPGGGHVQVSASPAPARVISTNGEAGAFWADVPVAPGSSAMNLHAVGDGPVDWLGWSVARAAPGVIYANLGIPSATVDLLDRWDAVIAQAEFARWQPRLIVLAFGTNEGFRDKLDPAAYEQAFTDKLAFLQRAAPGAAIVVMGPPDGQRRRARRHPESAACEAGWAIPANLPLVRELIRTAAARAGAYYWDWSAAMGGPCGMARMVHQVPPLAMPDHVHMRTPGYEATADALFDTLMQAYDRYRRGG
jgi:lysophospholipase L1-like esterase